MKAFLLAMVSVTAVLAALFVTRMETLPPAIERTISTYCDSSAVDGERVAVVGYPAFPERFMLVTSTINIDLFEAPEREGMRAHAAIPVGEGPNQIEDPQDDYSDADLLIRAENGDILNSDSRVRVEGRLLVSTVGAAERTCSLITPIRISAAP